MASEPLGDDGGGPDARRLLADLAIRAARIGTFDWDLETGALSWDDQLLRIFEHPPDSAMNSIDDFFGRVHPHDAARVAAALRTCIDTCGEYVIDYRIVLADGSTRWVSARGRALGDATGRATRLLGAAHDSTAARRSDARVARVLEATPTAFCSLDHDWRFTYVNAEAERILDRSRAELLGGRLWDLFPDSAASPVAARMRTALEAGEPVTFEAQGEADPSRWFEVRLWPSADGLAIYFIDITERRTERVRAERAAARTAMTARVTGALTATLDAGEVASRLARLVVPELADWCVVSLADAGSVGRRGLHDVGHWHDDPERRGLVAEYASLRLEALRPGALLDRSLETGEIALIETDATELERAMLAPGRAQEVLEELTPDALAVLPLRGRARTVGLLTLFRSRARGPLTDDDLATAREVAGRAGLALDNSRLYGQQRRLAEALQRSLLTRPPDPEHLQVAVRYVPAAASAQVGGDWYDAFEEPDGSLVLVVGDVAGHDVAAAAAMGQVRSLVRGIGVATGAAPAALVKEVDLAMRTLQMTTVATAVVARVEPSPDGEGGARLVWANAGHPPPLVVHPDGRVEELVGHGSGLLLGVQPEAYRRDSVADLPPGATVLLYTDGLVEQRSRGLRDGLDALRSSLADLAGRGLDDLCDTVVQRLVPERPEDDVALVAVRPRLRDASPPEEDLHRPEAPVAAPHP